MKLPITFVVAVIKFSASAANPVLKDYKGVLQSG